MHTIGEMNVCMCVLWKTKHYNRVSLFKDSYSTFRLCLGSEVYPETGSNTLCCNVTLDLCYWYMSTTKFVKSINRPPPYKYDAYVCWLYAESLSYIKCIEIIPLFTHFLVIDQYCKQPQHCTVIIMILYNQIFDLKSAISGKIQCIRSPKYRFI